MSEFLQGILGTCGIITALIYSMFCWWGGRDSDYLTVDNRMWGRRIAPLFFVTAIIIISLISHSFSWWALLAFPAYIVSHVMGYGGYQTIWMKLLRRGIWSLIRTGASLPFCISTGEYRIYAIQALVGLAVALLFGVTNPVKAPQEEGVINFSQAFLVPFIVL